MAEESWHHARLIPTSGINGTDEQERRATSALLAVLSAVKEFSTALLSPLGAPSGTPDCYIEVPFTVGDKKFQPDGLIRVTRGKRTWSALVEVKTKNNSLNADQISNYLDVARQEGVDAVITISNEIPPAANQHPTAVDGRKLRKVALHHWPWTYVLATAVLQKEHRGVSDPDQAWVLGELIRYLEHGKSGALEFQSMGSKWTGTRQAVTSGTLRANDAGAREVAANFDALLRFASLRLGARLGTDVIHVLGRKERADPTIRATALLSSLIEQNTLSGAISIPDTVGPIHLTADLRSGQITAHTDIAAPQTGRSATRVNWLARQLKTSPSDLRIEAFAANARGGGHAELLSAVRDDPSVVCPPPGKEIRSFRVAMTARMGTKRDRGHGSFVDSVIDLLDAFYADVVQNLKAWSAAPPRLRPADVVPSEEKPSESSTDLSSQDGPETGNAVVDREG